MRADYLSYKRATGASLLGLVVQCVFAASFLIYGILGGDHAAVSASIFMIVGVAGWLALVIVFDQHRRERIEAMEAESLSADATASTSVFDTKSDEFRVAARRLAAMYKFFLPGVSLTLAAVLIGFGIWRFKTGLEIVDPGKYPGTGLTGWQLGLGVGLAFVGFIFARYASGMAKQAVWQNLRAGASFAVGSALLGLALAIGQIVDIAGPDTVLRYLVLIIPAFLVGIGAETILNFVLDIYRPRKAGETPRPAFDSRLLGFIAAPDRIAQSISEAINYQLGFDVTSGWFYQLLSRSVGPLVVVGAVVMWSFTTIAVLQPHQSGTVLRFGQPVRENIGPGWHWKLPWPIETVYIPEYIKTDERGRKVVGDLTATGIRTVQLGTSPPGTAEPLLWTNDHLGDEVFQLVSSGLTVGQESESKGLTDFAMVSVEIPLNYAVKDVSLYDQLAPPMLREDLLKLVAQRELTQFFQTVKLDDVMGPRRIDLTSRIRERVQAAFDQLNPDATGKARGAGVEIVFVGVVGVHPPKDKDVASSFEKVVEADQRFQARIDDAYAEQVKALTTAAGSVENARAIIDAINAYEQAQREKADPARLHELESKLHKLLDSAGGEIAVQIAAAKAERWETHMRARGTAEEYKGQILAYEASPILFRAHAYFDALRTAMERSRLYVTDRNVAARVDLQDKDTGISAFKPVGDEEN